jgi:hypothetical protein
MGPDIPQDTKGGISMTLKEAITLFGYHQRSNLRARTVRSYQPLLQRLKSSLGNVPSILLDQMRYSNSWRHSRGIIPDPQGVSDMPN